MCQTWDEIKTMERSHAENRIAETLKSHPNGSGFFAYLDDGNPESIADLQKLAAILQNRGYSDQDIDQIFHQNFLRFLAGAWGAGG